MTSKPIHLTEDHADLIAGKLTDAYLLWADLAMLERHGHETGFKAGVASQKAREAEEIANMFDLIVQNSMGQNERGGIKNEHDN